MSKRAWGAPREPYDPDAGDSSADGEEEAPRRKAPAPKRSGSFAPITRAFGLIVLVFGLWTVGHRWKWVDGALDLRRLASGTREMAASLSELSGLPAEAQGLQGMAIPYEAMFLPLISGGVLGVLAGLLMVVLGALVVFQSPLAIRPGARGLLVAGGAYALAHACDVWLGHRTITMWEDAMRSVTERMGGDTGIQAALASAYENLTAATTPSLSDYVINALFWVVPVCVVLAWGWRHLESPDVAG